MSYQVSDRIVRPWVVASHLVGPDSPDIGDGRHAAQEVVVSSVPVDGDPTVTVTFTAAHGQVRCSEVRIVAVPGGREVRQGDLALSLAAVRDVFIPRTTGRHEWNDEGELVLRAGHEPDEQRGARRAVRDASRRKISDEALREVAEVYRDALANGGNPTQAVRDHLSVVRRNPKLSHRTAGDWIKRAREVGYLGASLGRGRKGEA